MFVGRPDLHRYRAYLDGYALNCDEGDVPEKSIFNLEFHNFVMNKLNYNSPTLGWANMIVAHCMGLQPDEIKWDNYLEGCSNSDHINSVAIFWELYDEYIK